MHHYDFIIHNTIRNHSEALAIPDESVTRSIADLTKPIHPAGDWNIDQGDSKASANPQTM
jgi:hypothetical protein